MYNIPYKWKRCSYLEDKDCKWKTRKKEYYNKTRLTKEDVDPGNMQRATERMNIGDGGLVKHVLTCFYFLFFWFFIISCLSVYVLYVLQVSISSFVILTFLWCSFFIVFQNLTEKQDIVV